MGKLISSLFRAGVVAYHAAILTIVAVLAVLAIILNVVLWLRGEPRPDFDDRLMLAIYAAAALAGIVAFIAPCALFMAWSNAFQWQLEALFFGPRSRIDSGQIKARIEAIEVELEARRRLGD